MIFYFLFLAACCLSVEVYGQRNAEAEGMCQPFLTSNFSSPLLPDIRRNLKIDEDGEYFCELVLQDVNLPAQVRVTIHEGLSYLAIRHVQMGLERHIDVLRHLKILAQIVPANFNFQFRAGVWSLDPMLAQPHEAVEYLRSALYGKASEDSSADEEAKMEARKHFALALGQVGEHGMAQKELLLILKQFPLDFGVAFLLKENLRQTQEAGEDVATGVVEDISSALLPSEEFHASVTRLAEVHYAGFRPAENWTPRHHQGMIDPVAFEDAVTQREPFVMHTSPHLSGDSDIDGALNWKVKQWSDVEYLRHSVGSEEHVLVERTSAKKSLNQNYKFGVNAGTFKTKMTFGAFLDRNFGKGEGAGDYLNLQDGYFRDGKWSGVLSKLRGDVPTLACLRSREENITSVNLWMSNAPAGATFTTRLHADPTDTLFVVLSGSKTFILHPPHLAPALSTLSPTFGVAPDGFSFQYNSPANLPGLDSRQIQGHEVGRGYYHFSSKASAEVAGGVAVKVKAGDVLFIPAGWFYETTTGSGPSMAVNYWWLPAHWRATLALEQRMKATLLHKLRAGATAGEL